MKLKALVSFCGKVSAGKGQEFSCPEETARDLISAGYAAEVEDEGEPNGTEVADETEEPTGTAEVEDEGEPNGTEVADETEEPTGTAEVEDEGEPNIDEGDIGTNKRRGKLSKSGR